MQTVQPILTHELSMEMEIRVIRNLTFQNRMYIMELRVGNLESILWFLEDAFRGEFGL